MTFREEKPTFQAVTLNIDYPLAFCRHVFHPSNPLLAEIISRKEPHRTHRIAVMIDSFVLKAWPKLIADIEHYATAHKSLICLDCDPLIIPGGESCKNDREVAGMHRWMLKNRLDRQSVLLSIGGGAMLDASGFAAATFHRGTRLVRLPTTVLAQNDAGIGIKNGINALGIKNMLGSFAAPFGVISDFNFLSTLDARDKRSGLAEAVKVALIRDRTFYQWLEHEAQALAAFSPQATEIMIRRCAELHLAHIANAGDPFELGSARPLDFGHWAAHKLESMTRYRLRHGEAVAIGIALDVIYSSKTGMLEAENAEAICALLETLGFTLWDEALDQDSGRKLLLEGLGEFREHLGGELTLTVLADIGRGIEVQSVDLAVFENALRTLSRRNLK